MKAGLMIVIMDITIDCLLTSVKYGTEDIQIIYQPKLRDNPNLHFGKQLVACFISIQLPFTQIHKREKNAL